MTLERRIIQGVYLITNNVTGDKYVGASKHIRRRFSGHKNPSKTNRLSKDIQLYGSDNFKFEVLEEVVDVENLAPRETYWINTIKPQYNVLKGSHRNVFDNFKDSLRETFRENGKKQWDKKSDEDKTRQIKNNLTGPKKGYIPSEEQKRNLRELQVGRKWSEATRAKMMQYIASPDYKKNNNQHQNKVICSYKDGLLVKCYESGTKAGEELKIHPSGITKALKNPERKAGGFKWKYKL